MLLYRDGDAAAFATLYTRHRGPLFRFILRQCGVAAVAEELFQDVWLNIINARQRYEARARFTTWLYQVARNRVIDHHRRSRIREAPVDAGSNDEVDKLAGPAGLQPDVGSEAGQRVDALLRALDALPEEQRTAFLLREEAGMGIGEIATVTGVNAETAKSRLRYAVKKLREGLREHHD